MGRDEEAASTVLKPDRYLILCSLAWHQLKKSLTAFTPSSTHDTYRCRLRNAAWYVWELWDKSFSISLQPGYAPSAECRRDLRVVHMQALLVEKKYLSWVGASLLEQSASWGFGFHLMLRSMLEDGTNTIIISVKKLPFDNHHSPAFCDQAEPFHLLPIAPTSPFPAPPPNPHMSLLSPRTLNWVQINRKIRLKLSNSQKTRLSFV